jgi:TPP-dependent pyruvate/acetoin dehydrogenase alpha subunit
MRMHGHGAHDDMRYVPREMFEEWEARDPIRLYERRLTEDGIDVESIRASVKEELDAATGWALDQAMPDPSVATAGVFAGTDPELGDGEAPWSRWRDGHA